MKVLSFFILLTVLLAGCGDSNKSEPPLLPYPHVVVWDKKAYVVTEATVGQKDLGEQIGVVKRYIDPNKAFPEKNEDSTIAPVGSKLYEITNIDIKDAFAVEFNGQFRKAEYYEP